jgi:hypothetical protein
VWRIQNLEKGEVTLDFSSAGLGPCRTSALIADDTTVVNATTLIEMEPDGCIQVLVCEACGTVHCEPGGWVQPRRFGDAVVWLPCFDRLANDGAEYRPPDYLKSRGLPFFGGSQAQQLGDLLPLFRSDVTARLAAREVVLLMQWLAPCQVLGKPGDSPRIERDMIIATADGELQPVLDQLDVLLQGFLSDGSQVAPVSAKPGPELYLDAGRSNPTWKPLDVDNTDSLRLSFDGVRAAVRDPG